MSPSARNVFRLFVAVYPPTEIARELVAALSRLELPAYRAVPAQQVHMTLQFIGDTPAPPLDKTTESVERSPDGVMGFDLQPRLLIRLPERGRSRLIAAEADRPAGLMEIQRRLAGRLARKARRNPSDRFRPHFTLCRCSFFFKYQCLPGPVAAASSTKNSRKLIFPPLESPLCGEFC